MSNRVKGGEVAVETVKGPDSKEQRIEHMVTLYQLPLLRLCIMYLHDEEQAKDAVQETFITLNKDEALCWQSLSESGQFQS